MQLRFASRRIKEPCICCGKSFKKGDPYWRHRQVWTDDYDGKISGFTHHICPRCKYQEEDRERRSRNLQERCRHPEHMVEMQYSYIPGEAVMQPDHYACRICNKVVV